MTDELGRVVVVAAGFALWIQGKCVAAARWSDIRRLRASRRALDNGGEVRLAVELTDGTMMELRESAPGFDLFGDRAATTLTSLRPLAEWRTSLGLSTGDESTVLYERATDPPTRPSRR